MTQVNLPFRPAPGDPEDVNEIMADLDAILEVLNGDVRNDNIAAAAAILVSKLAAGGSGDQVETSGGAPAWVKAAKCRGTRAGAQSIGNIAFTAITLTAEDYDNDTMLDVGGGNPSRITPHTSGLYVVTGGGIWAAHSTGNRFITLQKNGAVNHGAKQHPTVAAPDTTQQATSELIVFNGTTDYVELVVFQSSGGSLNFSSGWLSVARLMA